MFNRKGNTILLIALFFILFSFNTQSASADTVEALGWGWIGNSSGTAVTPGFISYNCENTSCAGGDYNVTVDTDTGAVNGLAWIGFVSSGGTFATGWIQFSDDANDYLNSGEALPSFVTSGAVYDGSSNVSGWARILTMGEYGWTVHSSNEWGWIKLSGDFDSDGDSVADGEYGMSFDAQAYQDMTAEGYSNDVYGKFTGFGYNHNPIAGTDFGLIMFDAASTDSSTTDAWLQTLQGDVYSQLGYNLSATSPEENATYLILSGGGAGSIVNFETAFADGLIEDYDSLDIPTESSSGIYRSNVGKINLNKYVDLDAGTCRSSDNCIEIDNSNYDTYLDGNNLAGKVYYVDGDLTIDQSLAIQNGFGDVTTNGEDALGNGTIIVNGDLNIENNIGYSSASIDNISNLASISWITLGDVNIDNSVTNLVGAFVVLENGVFDTSNTADSNQPFTLYGLVMAKQFYFDRIRTYDAGVEVPSEKLIYDGRTFANTPPSLEDLVATLPELNIAAP